MNLNPRTHRYPVSRIKPGHIVMETDEHPAVVVRVSAVQHDPTRLVLWCRYIWQSPDDAPWAMRPIHPSTHIDKVVG